MSVKCQSRVSRESVDILAEWRFTIGQQDDRQLVMRALVLHWQCIVEPFAKYWYRLCTSQQLTMPVKLFFFPTSSPRLFLLLQGTCQLTDMDTFLLITHIRCGWYQIDQTLNCRLFSSIGWHLHYLSVDIHVSVAILGESRSRVGWLTRQMRVDWGFSHYVD